jgi:hypothetical protein
MNGRESRFDLERWLWIAAAILLLLDQLVRLAEALVDLYFKIA